MAAEPVAVSWSGGKDSALALLRAHQAGAEVRTLLTLADEGGASKSHGLPRALLQAQADALGAELLWVPVPAGGYAAAFDGALQTLRRLGHGALVCGDIDLQAHRDWIVPRVTAAGLRPWFPLWGHTRRSVADALLELPVQAQLVAVDEAHLPPHFVGHPYDADLLAALPPGVCPCGEDGEFHTFVTHLPGAFRAPLRCRPGAARRVPNAPPLRAGWHTLQTPELLP